jgi:hypothetical protein
LAHKVYEIFKTITIGWLAQSLKQPKKITLKRLRSKEPFKAQPIDHMEKISTTPQI